MFGMGNGCYQEAVGNGAGGVEILPDLEILRGVELPKMSYKVMNSSVILVLNLLLSFGNC